jgi:hypothetical protein
MKAKLIKVEDEVGRFYVLESKETLPENYTLSRKNCEELLGIVNAYAECVEDANKSYHTLQRLQRSIGMNAYMRGFERAMELNKDKVFSKGDMAYIMNIMSIHDISFEDAIIKFQSLQQPTEIEVEIEMKYVGECKGNNDDGCFQDSPAHNCGCFTKKPKYDSNGDLILKKLEI